MRLSDPLIATAKYSPVVYLQNKGKHLCFGAKNKHKLLT